MSAQKTLNSVHGLKVMQKPQQTTRSLEKPATKKNGIEIEREQEREMGGGMGEVTGIKL